MTKKHFEALARALASSRPDTLTPGGMERIVRPQWDDDCIAIAKALAVVNPRFDMARFLTACRASS